MAIELGKRRRRLAFLRRRLRKARTPGPFIGQQDDSLGQVETSEVRVDRNRDDFRLQSDDFRLQAGALGAEQDR